MKSVKMQIPITIIQFKVDNIELNKAINAFITEEIYPWYEY